MFQTRIGPFPCSQDALLAKFHCLFLTLTSHNIRVVQALTSKRLDRSEIGFVIAEGKKLSQLLVELKIVKIKRDCNKVANELAALARRNTHATVWLDQAPGGTLTQRCG